MSKLYVGLLEHAQMKEGDVLIIEIDTEPKKAIRSLTLWI